MSKPGTPKFGLAVQKEARKGVSYTHGHRISLKTNQSQSA